MSILLTDKERYRLEKENIINVILDANRNGHDIDDAYLSRMLSLDLEEVNRLLLALKNDQIIK